MRRVTLQIVGSTSALARGLIMSTAVYGARNKIKAKVTDIKSDSIMSQVNFDTPSGQMSSVLNTESVEEMKLKLGDEVHLIIKAIHVLPVKNA